MNNHNLPPEELSGKKPLDGTYHISFEVKVSAAEEMALTDVIQSIAAGFEGTPLMEKLSKLVVEKLDKSGKHVNRTIKVGDKVRLVDDVTIQATVFEEKGFYVIGQPSESSIVLGEVRVKLPLHSEARVNKITAEGVELIDFDSVVSVPLQDSETDDLVETPVSVEWISVQPSSIQKVEE